MDEESEEFNEWNEFYESIDDTYLIGAWLQDEQGKYYSDETGDYSAIVRDITTQVVYSKTVKRVAALCSPCYPGQADIRIEDNKVLESSAGFLTFCLPDDCIYD